MFGVWFLLLGLYTPVPGRVYSDLMHLSLLLTSLHSRCKVYDLGALVAQHGGEIDRSFLQLRRCFTVTLSGGFRATLV